MDSRKVGLAFRVTGATFLGLSLLGLFLLRSLRDESELELPNHFEGRRLPVKYALDNDSGLVSRTPKLTTLSDIAVWRCEENLYWDRKFECARIKPFETTVWEVTVMVERIRREDDGDFVLVISDGLHRSCAEAPFPKFASSSRFSSQIRDVWNQLDQLMPKGQSNLKWGRRAKITGIGFFDPGHRSDGDHTSNGSELHPILELEWM